MRYLKYLKYIFWTFLVIIPCIVTVLIYNDKITQNSPMYYKQGVDFYNAGKYPDAFYNFNKIKWISPLYPIAIYKQAKSAQKTGDYKTAAYKYNLFLKKVPDSVFSTKASENLAKSYYYLKQYEEAKTEFEKLAVKINNPGTEETFFLGLLEKNYDKNKAANYFRQYLKSILNGDAINKYYIIASAKELLNLGIELSNEDLKLIGTAYFREHKYKDALECFSKLPVEDCWDYFVLANNYVGNRVIAKKLIEDGLKFYGNQAQEDNLYAIYNIYTSYQSSSKLKNWIQTEKFVKENNLKGSDYILYKLAELSTKEKAIIYYKSIYQNYPDGKYAAESLWHIIWNEYKQKNYKEAENLIRTHLKTYKKVKSTPKVMFWLGKIYLKENKIQEANSVFNKLAVKHPDDYYGLRASYINKKNEFWQTEKKDKLPEEKCDIDFPISSADINLKDLKLINTLFKMGDYEIWQDADFSNPILESWFEFKKGNKSHSIVLARDEISQMDLKAPIISSAYKLSYPLYMVKEINIAGEKLNIDPYLITSIIREESYFNEHAKSRTGAVGLMQLMPQTAAYMLGKLNEEEMIDIEDARVNLYLGSNYLKYLKERFNNDLYVVAAYNGGEGSVNKWIKNFNNDDYDEFIEDIPYDETRNYVKKVFRTYQMYRKIYK